MGLVKTVREVANETGRFMGNRFTPGMAMFGRGLGDLLAAPLSFRRAGAIVGGFGVPLAQAYTMAYMHTGDHLSAAFNTPFALIIDAPLYLSEAPLLAAAGYSGGEQLDQLRGDPTRRADWFVMLHAHHRRGQMNAAARRRMREDPYHNSPYHTRPTPRR